MGDYFDTFSTSERDILANPKLHESTQNTFDNRLLEDTLKFSKEIEFMNGRLIGLMEGNHYGVFHSTAITTTQKLSEIMKTKYLGVCAFIRLGVTIHGACMKLDIFAHHGRGSARTLGGGLNPVAQMESVAEADIYLMGDNHQKVLGDANKLRLIGRTKDELFIRKRKKIYARTGSFLKGYEENKRSYVTDALYPPTDMGVVKIYLTPRRTYKGARNMQHAETWIDVHASL